MKRLNLIWAFAICLFIASGCGDKIIPNTELPVEAQTFIKANFPDSPISYAKKDYEGLSYKYEVRLNDGTQIDFTKRGDWDKVDCQMSAVPEVLVPAMIANYVQTNYAGSVIVKIDKERYGHKIELSNDLELKFDKSGNLFDIDD
ncbi:MAG: PepSY-like domain-containing protein [Bacteroidales bacterium]|nr:PepSY-like domain-containing protein [Bacteroidales bacterium]